MTIVHTIGRTFTAGGIVEYPTEAEPLFGEHEGITLSAGDGTPTNVWAGGKRRWRYTWKSPRPEIVARWLTRYKARASLSVVDPDGGAAYTAILPVGTCQVVYTYEPTSATAGGTTYTLTLELWEL
ncbi:MAG TPA: hypothetical protein PKD53_04725 [Chloroflexaceae bacterium]|nr:hypothetical protein [Chloroflexaceae bacterium]